MIDVVAIHMEVSGSGHLEHIAKLRWIESSEAGERGTGHAQGSTRGEMYAFVKKNPKIDNGHIQYVKTTLDSSRADNLLSLSRF